MRTHLTFFFFNFMYRIHKICTYIRVYLYANERMMVFFFFFFEDQKLCACFVIHLNTKCDQEAMPGIFSREFFERSESANRLKILDEFLFRKGEKKIPGPRGSSRLFSFSVS